MGFDESNASLRSSESKESSEIAPSPCSKILRPFQRMQLV